MKKAFTVLFIISLTVVVTWIFLSEHFTGHFPWTVPKTEGVIYTSLHSEILGQDRELIVHLPLHYDSTLRYPVIYVLDGSSDDAAIAGKFEVLSAAGYAPETIVVGIPNMTAENRQRNLVPPFMRIDAEDNTSPMGGGDVFLSFMEKELFPFMEQNYSASRERLFSGNSRGGLLVMYSLVHKPELFAARFCYSTPFWRQDNILVTKVTDFLSSTDTLHTFLYVSAGSNETENIKSGLAKLTAVLTEKAPVGMVWYAEITPNAIHHDNAQVSSSRGIGKWGAYRGDLKN